MERSLSENGSSGTYGSSEEEMSITKGPWTEEEDSVLFDYITVHGEGHWNSVARNTGMQRYFFIRISTHDSSILIKSNSCFELQV